jgi:hypothetical protein
MIKNTGTHQTYIIKINFFKPNKTRFFCKLTAQLVRGGFGQLKDHLSELV